MSSLTGRIVDKLLSVCAGTLRSSGSAETDDAFDASWRSSLIVFAHKLSCPESRRRTGHLLISYCSTGVRSRESSSYKAICTTLAFSEIKRFSARVTFTAQLTEKILLSAFACHSGNPLPSASFFLTPDVRRLIRTVIGVGAKFAVSVCLVLFDQSHFLANMSKTETATTQGKKTNEPQRRRKQDENYNGEASSQCLIDSKKCQPNDSKKLIGPNICRGVRDCRPQVNYQEYDYSNPYR